MKKFLKEMIGKSVEEVIEIAKAEGFEFEYHAQTEDDFASMDFEFSGYDPYLIFDEKGIADDWSCYSRE